MSFTNEKDMFGCPMKARLSFEDYLGHQLEAWERDREQARINCENALTKFRLAEQSLVDFPLEAEDVSLVYYPADQPDMELPWNMKAYDAVFIPYCRVPVPKDYKFSGHCLNDHGLHEPFPVPPDLLKQIVESEGFKHELEYCKNNLSTIAEFMKRIEDCVTGKLDASFMPPIRLIFYAHPSVQRYNFERREAQYKLAKDALREATENKVSHDKPNPFIVYRDLVRQAKAEYCDMEEIPAVTKFLNANETGIDHSQALFLKSVLLLYVDTCIKDQYADLREDIMADTMELENVEHEHDER